MLAATAGVGAGAVALAGCVEEEDDEDKAANESESEDSAPAVVTRPRLPGDPSDIDNDLQRFLAESADYQNRLLEEIHDEVA